MHSFWFGFISALVQGLSFAMLYAYLHRKHIAGVALEVRTFGELAVNYLVHIAIVCLPWSGLMYLFHYLNGMWGPTSSYSPGLLFWNALLAGAFFVPLFTLLCSQKRETWFVRQRAPLSAMEYYDFTDHLGMAASTYGKVKRSSVRYYTSAFCLGLCLSIGWMLILGVSRPTEVLALTLASESIVDNAVRPIAPRTSAKSPGKPPVVVRDNLTQVEIMEEISKLGCFVVRRNEADFRGISIGITSSLPSMSRNNLELALAYAKKLTSPVEIEWMRLRDEDLALLRDLTSVTRLNLRDARISDEALGNLTHLTRLEVLDLSNASISDVGLTQLYGMKSLRGLHVTGTKVTRKGVESLKKALPQLTVPFF